ncbi:MAG: L,D-transpeptidase [Flavobacteriales bacterium]|nr:L,D-transpeptidase [Flavobacteriales bacterium]
MRAHLICALAVLPVVAGCRPSPPASTLEQGPTVTKTREPLPLVQLLDSLNFDGRDMTFRVDKSDRRFAVFAGEHLLRTYPCVLGEVPEGDKQMQGDRRTPEGEFGIRSKRMHEKWHAFVWVDYPNAESRRRFAERKRTGAIPAGAAIGGEIGIHGVPEGMDHWIDMGQDWTWGCIALRNADLDEIYPFITSGRTRISIVP